MKKTYLPILIHLFDNKDKLDKQRQISEFQEVVGAIVILESFFSISALGNLLNILQNDISCRLDLLHSVFNIPADKDMPVKLLHLSFCSFLFDTKRQEKSPFWIDEKEIQKRLAGKCLYLLSSLKGLRQNICNLAPGTLKNEINSQVISNALSLEVQYACHYQIHHLVESGKKLRNGDLVDTFLQHYFLYWLEAMSPMKKAFKNICIVNSLQSLINVRFSETLMLVLIFTYYLGQQEYCNLWVSS